MRSPLFAILFSIGWSAVAWAGPSAIPRLPVPPGPISSAALIVTHASRIFDPTGGVGPALDQAIADHKARGLPVIYLMNEDGTDDAHWVTKDRDPSFALASRSGEHALEIDSSELTFAGGYFELCQADSVKRAAQSYFRRHPRARTFIAHFPMGATYSERYAFRDPGREVWPIEGMLSLDHDPTLREALDVLGSADSASGRELRFVRSLKGGTSLVADQFCVKAVSPSGQVARYGDSCRRRRARTVEFRFHL